MARSTDSTERIAVYDAPEGGSIVGIFSGAGGFAPKGAVGEPDPASSVDSTVVQVAEPHGPWEYPAKLSTRRVTSEGTSASIDFRE